MRISERQIFDGANLRGQQARARMDEATEVASTGLKIRTADDNPVGVALSTARRERRFRDRRRVHLAGTERLDRKSVV